jgi:hypothetical protein
MKCQTLLWSTRFIRQWSQARGYPVWFGYMTRGQTCSLMTGKVSPNDMYRKWAYGDGGMLRPGREDCSMRTQRTAYNNHRVRWYGAASQYY